MPSPAPSESREHISQDRRRKRKRNGLDAKQKEKFRADAQVRRENAALNAQQTSLQVVREMEQSVNLFKRQEEVQLQARELRLQREDVERIRAKETRDAEKAERNRRWAEEVVRHLALKEAQRVENEQLSLLRVEARKQAYNRQQSERRRRESERLREEEAAAMDIIGGARDLPRLGLPRVRAPRRLLPAFEGIIPSFLKEEFEYMSEVSSTFPETITPSIQMSCLQAYQVAISHASRRLPCGICGGLYQEDRLFSTSLQDSNLQSFLHITGTRPDSCAVAGDKVTICSTCSSHIRKNEVPPLSAGNFVNRLFCQEYPDVLKGLNTVEERFIARAHVIGAFLKLTSGAQKGISYRGGRGHYVAVKQDPSNLLMILPTRKLLAHTTITVSWEHNTPPSEENLARFCSVDKSKVLHALLWLCANNPVYKSVKIDYELLDSWPDNHIPQEIRDAFLTLRLGDTTVGPTVTDEREGYATQLQNGRFENELDAELEDPEPGSIVSRSFFSDFHGQDLQSTPAVLASLQAVLDDDGSPNPVLQIDNDDIIVSAGKERNASSSSSNPPWTPYISYKKNPEAPILDSFTNPDYFTGAFPTLFPFGIGGHLGDISGNRPKKVSLKDFAKYTMMHHSHMFSQHPNFMFYLYDLILIRQASLGNYLQVKKGYWSKATADLAKLSGDDLHLAATQFKNKDKISNPIIHTLINNMRIISSFNPESYGEKIRLRNLIFGKIGRLGIPLIWFTLNPQDIGNIFVVQLAGEDVSLDNAGIQATLLKLTLKNPSLVAQYFHAIITAFFDCFFKSLAKDSGIFGTVSSHFGIVESTTRMMMHLHGFAWLTGNFGAANLSERLLIDPDFKARLITYIQSIVRETVDLTEGQRFTSKPPPGSAVFHIPAQMSHEEFQEALDLDSNNIAARVQMHVHSATCTKYQRKNMKSCVASQAILQADIVTPDSEGPPINQQPLSQSQFGAKSLLQVCRFLFPRPLVPESMVTDRGVIKMIRNHQFVNKYNPVISSAVRCNHDVNFTPSSPKVLAAVFYMTNYATKCQVDRGQLVLAAAVLKKAQEVAEAEAAADSGLPIPKPLDMSKFALKAYHRFTRDTEVGAPAVAQFLLGQPSFYVPQGGKPVTINFYWVKISVQGALASVLDVSSTERATEDAEQYNSFDLHGRRPSIYENYRKRGPRLAQLCFYEYVSQFFVQTFESAKGRSICFPFEASHPQHATHIQVSVGSHANLATPSLCGSFTRLQEPDSAVLPSTLQTQDEIDETLLGLFYPWNRLRIDFQGEQLMVLQSSYFKNTYLWNLVKTSLPPYLLHLSENVMLLRRSKEAADQDRKDRGIEFNEYIEASDENLYNNEETSIELDFTTLQPTHHNLLQAALDLRGISLQGSSQLRYLHNPLIVGSQFCDSSIVKAWGKEIKSYREPTALDSDDTLSFPLSDPSAALIPTLSLPRTFTTSLPDLQATFQANPTTDSVITLLASKYPLNQKQEIIARALLNRILQPIPIRTVEDQFLLYLGGVGGSGKTHLIKAVLFGLSIIQKQDDVLLTASTGAAAANIGGATYHSALGLYGSKPISQAAKLRLAHKKIFIVDEVSMVGLEALVQLDDRCNSIWDCKRESSTVFGGLPIVIFLGDFNQFKPVGGHSIWSQNTYNNPVLQAGRHLWCHFKRVVFLTEQMRQAEDVPLQDMLRRARSATLTEDDVAVLNSQTVAARTARGQIPPVRAVIRVNRLREEVNLEQLEAFARKRSQKIYLFPGRHDGPTIENLHQAVLLRRMFQVGEAGRLKGPGFFAFSKGMPIMLLKNTSTISGLVNGMTATAEEAILDKDIQGKYSTRLTAYTLILLIATWIELDDLYVLCTVPLICVLVHPSHDYKLSLSGLPETLVPILPIEMKGEIADMGDLPFHRHQVPVTLGFAITDYKCQGSTFVELIVDLRFASQRGLDQHKKWTSINVQLGRLTSLSGVWLREAITLADVQARPHIDLQVELSRLEVLEHATLQAWMAS